MPQPITISRLAIAAFLAAFSLTASAQQGSFRHLLDSAVAESCPVLVAGVSDTKELAPALAARPIDTAAVCRCMSDTVVRDARLSQLFESDAVTLNQRISAKPVQAYMIARLFTAAIACLTPELDASTAAMPFEPKPATTAR